VKQFPKLRFLFYRIRDNGDDPAIVLQTGMVTILVPHFAQ
jgi:hypothetical protein